MNYLLQAGYKNYIKRAIPGLVFFLFFFFSFYFSKAAESIVIEEGKIYEDFLFTGTLLDLFEDKSKKLTIDIIAFPEFRDNFERHEKVQAPQNINLRSVYWARFSVQNKSSQKTGWIIELYDFRIDSFELYIPDGRGGFVVEKGGDNYPFSNKKYKHKNFAFNHPDFISEKPQFYYLKVYAENPAGIIGVIRTTNRFLHYATIEYYLIALFYGILFFMGLYNIVLYLTVKDKAYLFFVLYLFSFGIYAMCQDGTGFQFLWPNHPELNRYMSSLSLLFVIVFVLLYAKYFLVTKKNSVFFDRTFLILSLVRVVLFIIGIGFSPVLLYKYLIYYDTFCVIIIFIAGIDCYFRIKYSPAKYYILAFTFFFMGFILTMLDNMGVFDPGVYIAYSLNLGVIIQMFLLSLALGDKIRSLMKEKQIAQNETIIQLQEKEYLKDKINRELEQKVIERTMELQEKNNQLDTFVYKASHDIRGPLKSVIGLTTVGLKDIKDESSRLYFEHILKSTKKLDQLLTELLALTKVQQSGVEETNIDIKDLISEVISSFCNFEGYDKMNFQVNVFQIGDFHSDRKLVYSIIQNMVENGIKYRDGKKTQCNFSIDVTSNVEKTIFRFKDNGLGIPQGFQNKIFEMFFKVNNSSVGSGLGLHIVKLSLEKLKGKITIESNPGEGSVFVVEI